MSNFFDNELVCGAEFFRYPGPCFDELKKDLERFAADGFNYVRVQQNWAYEEPCPGQYDFSRTREIVAYAEKLGLNVILTLCLENAPTWLYLENDVYQRNSYGEKVIHTIPYPIPADGKPGPCFDNPAAVAAAERFTEAFVAEFSRFDAVKGWAVWQESHSGSMCDNHPDADYCWCEHTAAAFIAWLKEKYTTLEATNKALLTNYGKWEYIMPPYAFGGTKQTPLYTEYANFLRLRLGRIAAWKKALVARCDPRHRPVMCHTVLSMVSGQLGRYWADDYIIAKEMDVFGASLYPSVTHGTWNDVVSIMFVLDSARCAADGKPNWAAELQGGRPASLLWHGEAPSCNDIANWGITSLARGVKGIVWWSYREETFCQESFGFGMLDRKGEPFEWYSEICKMNAFMNRNRDIILASHPEKARVAIAVDASNNLFAFEKNAEYLVSDSIRGIYTALLRHGVYPDFIWKEQILENRLADYSLVFLPLPLSMSAEYVEKLKEYVANGGSVVSEAYLASYDELSNAQLTIPSFGLDQLFGAREETIYQNTNRGFIKEFYGKGDFADITVNSAEFSQTFSSSTGETIFSDVLGQTLGVKNHFGNGKTYLLGTLFSHLLQNDPLLERILVLNQVPVTDSSSPMIQSLTGNRGQLLSIYNRSQETVSLELPIPIGMYFCDSYAAAEVIGQSVRTVIPPLSANCIVFAK